MARVNVNNVLVDHPALRVLQNQYLAHLVFIVE